MFRFEKYVLFVVPPCLDYNKGTECLGDSKCLQGQMLSFLPCESPTCLGAELQWDIHLLRWRFRAVTLNALPLRSIS